MSKLRIVNKGWETYTGYLGQIEFVNGTSVKDIEQVLLDTYKLNDIQFEILPDKQPEVKRRGK